jgi:predicted MPP superfamily phosphohydrolase
MLIYMRYEASAVKVERVKFASSGTGLKIIQLSDIHIKFLRVSVKTIKNVIAKEKPDLIILTGDYIDNPRDIRKFSDFITQLRGNAAIYSCLGNHDYKAVKRYGNGSKSPIGSQNNSNKSGNNSKSSISSQNSSNANFLMEILKSNGINILHNQASCYIKNNIKYNIIGIEDLYAGSPEINKALASCRKDAFMNIAFSHNPDIVYEIPGGKIDYLFCGHFHGGQIWTPFKLEFMLLRRERLCKIGITRGLHKVNGIILYINRGLGNVCFPLRFLSRPEITVFYLP